MIEVWVYNPLDQHASTLCFNDYEEFDPFLQNNIMENIVSRCDSNFHCPGRELPDNVRQGKQSLTAYTGLGIINNNHY